MKGACKQRYNLAGHGIICVLGAIQINLWALSDRFVYSG